MRVTWKGSALEHASKKLQEAKDILARYDEHELAGQVGAVLRELKVIYDLELADEK